MKPKLQTIQFPKPTRPPPPPPTREELRVWIDRFVRELLLSAKDLTK